MKSKIEIGTVGTVNTEFDLYKEEIIPKYNELIKTKTEEFENFIDDIFEFYLFCSFLLNGNKVPFKEHKYNALWFLFKRSSITFLGVITMFNSKCFSEFPATIKMVA